MAGKDKRVVNPAVVVGRLDLTVTPCPRCNQEHQTVTVKRLKVGVGQQYDYKGRLEAGWRYWATCPTTSEPILLNVDIEVEPVPEEAGVRRVVEDED
ncbi:MAG: hypothetical protein ACLFWG_10160 [Longimicrobiales bacterium]